MRHLLLFCFVWGFLPFISFGQISSDQHNINFTIPDFAILDIEPDNSGFSLSLDIPITAGAPPTVGANSINSDKWLNYTSAITTGSSNKNISAQISNGSLPAGIELKLTVGGYSGAGAGTLGSSVGSIFLSNTNQTIITGIGGAYTGTGTANGHRLTFELVLDDPEVLDAGDSDIIEVTYTISN